MAYKVTLLEWGLEKFTDAFEEEGIDDNSFMLIDEETVNKIFNKSGPKLIFKQKYKEYLNTKNSSVKETEVNPQKENEEENCSVVSVIETESQTESVLSSSYSFEPDEELLKELEGITSNQAFCLPSKRKTDSVASSPTKKTKSSVFIQGLEETLKQSTEGKIVLLNRSELNNDHRQKLVKTVINDLIRTYGNEIKAGTFVKAAEEIGLFFPNERSETYYIPYEKKNNKDKGTPPKGKLWSRYIYIRHALKLACSSGDISTDIFDYSQSEKVISEEEEAFLNFLQIATEPYFRILEAWEATFMQRKKIYLNATLQKLFNDFPCLKLNNGIELIETDFNRKFPEKTDVIYSNWPKICTALLREATERKVVVPEDCDTSLQAVTILPYLFSPITVKKSRKGGIWRPSRSEVSESL